MMDLNLIPNIKHASSNNFFLLAGPCAIESEEMAMRIAEKLVGITDKLEIPFVFKGSFKKANRSRIDSFSGIGDEKALKILRKVSKFIAGTSEDAIMPIPVFYDVKTGKVLVEMLPKELREEYADI